MTTDKMPCHITDGPPSDDPRDDDWTLPEGKGNYADGSQELYDSWDYDPFKTYLESFVRSPDYDFEREFEQAIEAIVADNKALARE